MPHPHRALDRRLGIDLGVIDVDFFGPERLAGRTQHPRRADERAESGGAGRAVLLVDPEDRTYAAGALADHGFVLDPGEAGGFAAQHGDLGLGEQPRKDEVAVALELVELNAAQWHGWDATRVLEKNYF